MDIAFDPEFTGRVAGYRLLLVEAEVENPPTSDGLWALIAAEGEALRGSTPMEMINKRPAIAATRAAYKACGKEPNRYRPSAEALCRRLVKGMELYRTLTLIDLINLISIRTGHSIGGFDAERIEGPLLTLGVGRDGEQFEAIGRGPLNIAGLPVWRDSAGGIGTPTSDNERTKLTPATRRLLMTVNIYAPATDAAELERMIADTLRLHARATRIDTRLVIPPGDDSL